MREVVTLKEYYISIHALRVEGDVIYIFIFVFVPSISIHALRVEGDPHNMYAIACTHFISIHALRVEGDSHTQDNGTSHGISIHALRVEGDTFDIPRYVKASLFLSTPSGWRATGGCAHG